MKRPVLLFAIALIGGILAAQVVKSIIILIIPAVLITLILLIKQRDRAYRYICIGMLVFYSLGALEYLFVDNNTTKHYSEYVGQRVTVKGHIVSEPDIRDSRVNYTLKTSRIISGSRVSRVSGKLLFTTLNTNKQSMYAYGQEITVSGQINPPKGVRNPGGFDYGRYLAQSGISATIFAMDDAIVKGNVNRGNFFVKLGLDIRGKLVSVINKCLPKQQAGLLNGMLIGYTDDLSKNVKTAFSDAGLSHIMAVSGANIAFIMLPLVLFFKKIRLGTKASNTFIIAFLVLFVLVTGFSPSVVRAVIMAITILAAQMIWRQTEVISSLSFAAILLLLHNPYTLFDIGFQLSFTATLSIVLFYKYIKEKISYKHIPEKITEALGVTLAAQVGVLPITAFYFNKVSIISLLSNLVVVPVLELITLLGFSMAILGQFYIFGAKLIGYVNNALLSFVLYVTKTSAELPFSVFTIITPPAVTVILYYIAIGFVLWYAPRYNIRVKPVYYAVCSALILLVVAVNLLLPKQLEVVFLDVGQGDSIFIKTTKGRTVLIDGGNSGMGESVIMPFLLDSGTPTLDLVVATHGHDDHIKGLMPILEEYSVKNLILPYIGDSGEFSSLLDIAAARKINVRFCDQGDIIKLDDKTRLDILYPSKDFKTDNTLSKTDNTFLKTDNTFAKTDNTSLNNHSIVLKLQYKNVDMLFTGDIEKEVEEFLVKSGEALDADILKVAHHGSSTSSSVDFIEKVNPKAAIISVGKNNFGHPSRSVLERFNTRKTGLYRTDQSGGIVLTSDGNSIRLKKTVDKGK